MLLRRLSSFLGLGLVLFACKSPEEKFCERAKASYPPDPSVCRMEYLQSTPEQRACLDECTSGRKDQRSFDSCSAGCFRRSRGEESGPNDINGR